MLSINKQDKCVAEYIKKCGVKYEARHLAEMLHDEWKHDLFYITFQNNNGKISDFEYKTGIGHRLTPDNKSFRNTLSARQNRERKALKELLGVNPTVQAKHATSKKPVSQEWIVLPTQASVLYCLLSDADAQNYSFDDWCDMLGYSSDSIEHLNIYKTCLKNTKKLSKVFSREQIKKLNELLEDY